MHTKILLFFLVFGIGFLPLVSQVDLKPSIGIDAFPDDEDPVCSIPLYLDSFAESGFEEGDTIPDFKLYDLEGNALIMSELLANEKPVLLVAGSYTCPVFRNKIPVLNDLSDLYGDQLEILIVYTLEAHPNIDISPYYGFENVTNANLLEQVLYQQPTTYGERKQVLEDMLNELDVQVPLVLDGPCNEWWENFGPAPNNAYLISPQGTVMKKHPWFDKYPESIYCDLYDFFDWGSPCDISSAGTFDFYFAGDSLVTGTPGETLYIQCGLENISESNVVINIRRMEEVVPPGWKTAMCTDICLSPDVEQTSVQLAPGEFLPYIMYFYTDDSPAEGKSLIAFRNQDSLDNNFLQWMYGQTDDAVSSQNIPAPKQIGLFPNPTSGSFQLVLPDRFWDENNNPMVQIFNAGGALVYSGNLHASKLTLASSNFPAGLYFIHVLQEGTLLGKGKLLIQRN